MDQQSPHHSPAQQPGSNQAYQQQHQQAPPPVYVPAQQGHAPAGGYAMAPAYATGQQVQPRNPVLHALASLVIPGLGTMLGGRVGRGLAILGVEFITFLFFLIPFIGWLLLPVLLLIWVVSGVDGYRTAQKWNRQHGIIS